MRPAGFMPQGMLGPQHRMLSPGQPGMMGGPPMMQGKERGGLYGHPAPGGAPNMMMSLHGMAGPQQTMMLPPQMRPRGGRRRGGVPPGQGTSCSELLTLQVLLQKRHKPTNTHNGHQE
ncbi:hypothetical protein AAFF_G00132280 [Aldrovandia affinis]|uniref:Uncharacterized protein n=1 Tax=Aldrovandia affinis TaxID=143900 RepID=A0AAD7WA58_9TELE|nr:hypothetical protein AAFF_G00132280 [Aldrovandia affinis]